jgi:hypothetical protein
VIKGFWTYGYTAASAFNKVRNGSSPLARRRDHAAELLLPTACRPRSDAAAAGNAAQRARTPCSASCRHRKRCVHHWWRPVGQRMVSPPAGLHWQVPIEEPPAETRWQDTPTPPNEVRRSQQSNHACASPCHHISRRDDSCGLAGLSITSTGCQSCLVGGSGAVRARLGATAPWARLNGGAVSQAMLLSAFRLAGRVVSPGDHSHAPVRMWCHSQLHCSATCPAAFNLVFRSIECPGPRAMWNGSAVSWAMLSTFRLAGRVVSPGDHSPPVRVWCHSQLCCSATCSQQPSIWHSIA